MPVAEMPLVLRRRATAEMVVAWVAVLAAAAAVTADRVQTGRQATAALLAAAVGADRSSDAVETPAAVAHKERQERQAQAEESIDQDEFVREAVALFDAKVVEDTTRPL